MVFCYLTLCFACLLLRRHCDCRGGNDQPLACRSIEKQPAQFFACMIVGDAAMQHVPPQQEAAPGAETTREVSQTNFVCCK